MRFDTLSVAAGTAELLERLRTHRREVHKQPELGFAEHRTAAYIESVLDEVGVPHRRVVGTGVVGVIKGDGAGCIGVRADMDALPVPEALGREGYRSRVEGISHACGHDGHVAILLGLAELLKGIDQLPGTVVLYFQPAEEGPGGAMPMIAAGVLDDPAPQAVIALHVSPRHPAGVVALRSGPITASSDQITITVNGAGGHAAHPEAAIDAVPIAAQVVLAVQQFVAREVDPVRPVVVTFGTINGGTRHNVIASSVTLDGTMRAVHQHTRELLCRRVPEIAQAVAATHRATATVKLTPGGPVGFNDPGLTELVATASRAALGPERVIYEPDPTLVGEDFFAFGTTGLPVSLFWLGVANPALGITAPAHSPEFDLDENALPVGVQVFAEMTRRWLEGYSGSASSQTSQTQ
ncbi:MAG: M20 metallopeptidase family protein [Pseudonocardiaceae bacterium]